MMEFYVYKELLLMNYILKLILNNFIFNGCILMIKI